MQLDAIWTRARADLAITTKHGDSDLFLWEHCARVAHSGRHIARLAVESSTDVDEAALVAAALYHDAAWVVRWRDGEIDRTQVHLTPTTETGFEQGALTLERSLADLLRPASIERAAEAIRSMGRQGADSIEGRVLSEAHNLDEFGVLQLWTAIRRGILEGKGVQAVIDMWERKKEYQFWTARLEDSFRFKPVRELAEQRIRQFERLMRELKEEHLSKDIERIARAQITNRAFEPTAPA